MLSFVKSYKLYFLIMYTRYLHNCITIFVFVIYFGENCIYQDKNQVTKFKYSKTNLKFKG